MMNLNLKTKPTYLFILLIGVLLFCNKTYAQSKSLVRFGVTLSPGISTAALFGKDSISKAYLNSEAGNYTIKTNIGANLWVRYLIQRKLDVLAGIGFNNIGYTRNQENLQLYDKTYPGIGTGRIEELSNNTKNLYYQYNFNYLQVPVLLNWYINSTADYKVHFAYTAGTSLNILLNHNIIAKTNQGYTIESKSKFALDSTGFTAKPVNLSFLLGGRVEFQLDKKIDLLVQPLLNLTPLNITQKPFTTIPFALFVNVGFTYTLKD